VLTEPLFAFYDLRRKEVPAIEEIVVSPVAFAVWVMRRAVTSGLWTILGHVALTDDLLRQPDFFKQDPISRRLFLTKVGAGDERPASFEECIGLECAAAWDPEHVEDRLRDHFAGRPNKWVESMRPRRVP
jgi:hypothetical protein